MKTMSDEEYARNMSEEARELFEKLLDDASYTWSGFVETLIRHERRENVEEVFYFLKEALNE